MLHTCFLFTQWIICPYYSTLSLIETWGIPLQVLNPIFPSCNNINSPLLSHWEANEQLWLNPP